MFVFVNFLLILEALEGEILTYKEGWLRKNLAELRYSNVGADKCNGSGGNGSSGDGCGNDGRRKLSLSAPHPSRSTFVLRLNNTNKIGNNETNNVEEEKKIEDSKRRLSDTHHPTTQTECTASSRQSKEHMSLELCIDISGSRSRVISEFGSNFRYCQFLNNSGLLASQVLHQSLPFEATFESYGEALHNGNGGLAVSRRLGVANGQSEGCQVNMCIVGVVPSGMLPFFKGQKDNFEKDISPSGVVQQMTHCKENESVSQNMMQLEDEAQKFRELLPFLHMCKFFLVAIKDIHK